MMADALELLSAIPFFISGKRALAPKEWCFVLSFDWGLPYGLTPTLALKILRLALDEGILEERDGQLLMSKEVHIKPLFFHGKKIDFSGLKDVEPYPLEFKIEVSREEVKKQVSALIDTAAKKPAAKRKKTDKPAETSPPAAEAAVQPEKTGEKEERKEAKKKEEKRKEEEKKFKQTTLF
ncbi:MAG: hypothetical protein QW461_01770 [Candidatus Jordarchaeales archaeon]